MITTKFVPQTDIQLSLTLLAWMQLEFIKLYKEAPTVCWLTEELYYSTRTWTIDSYVESQVLPPCCLARGFGGNHAVIMADFNHQLAYTSNYLI